MSALFTAAATITAHSDAALDSLVETFLAAGIFRMQENGLIYTFLSDDEEPIDTQPIDKKSRILTLAYGQYAGIQNILISLQSDLDNYHVDALLFCAETPEIMTFYGDQAVILSGVDSIVSRIESASAGVYAYLRGGYEALDAMDDIDECAVLDEVDIVMASMAVAQLTETQSRSKTTRNLPHGS
jgi:hypothetical protein